MKYTNAGWVMRERSILNNLNCNMQAHARVCKENELELEELEKNDAYWNNFEVTGMSLKDHIGRMRGVSRQCSQGWFTIA